MVDLGIDRIIDGLAGNLDGLFGKATSGVRDQFAGVDFGGAATDSLALPQATPTDPFARVRFGMPQSNDSATPSAFPNPFAGFDRALQRVRDGQAQSPTQRTGPADEYTNGEGYSGPATSDDNKALTAQQIDQWIATTRPNSPLAGKGAYILSVANQNGVSAPLMLGIFLKETELGTTASPTAKNLSGIVAPTDGGLGTTRQFNGYASWEESIAATARNLATPLYRGKSLAEQIGSWYVGPGEYSINGLASTDKAGNGTVGDYVNMVAKVYQQLGLTPNATQGGTATAAQAGAAGLIDRAKSLIGTPYQLGGRRVNKDPRLGIDCSEYTAWIYEQAGVTLPWNAAQQFNATQRVNAQQLQPGDLVFFHSTYASADGEYITHVGMYLGGGKFINSQEGGVQVADMNNQYWRDHYAGAGRVKR